MAEELSGQAVQLSETISFFKLGNESAAPDTARQSVGSAQACKGVTLGNAPAGTPRAKVAQQTMLKSTQASIMPKAHTREGIVLNLDDEGTARAGTDAEDGNFKEF